MHTIMHCNIHVLLCYEFNDDLCFPIMLSLLIHDVYFITIITLTYYSYYHLFNI